MSKIQFYSTNLGAPRVDLRGALMNGLAPDRGLYMPESLPQLSQAEIADFADKPYHQIAESILSLFTEGVLDRQVLSNLCRDAYNYDTPLEKVYDRVHVLRLDQGPTASFKDYAARMMARILGIFVKEQGSELNILTATSGDTGSAVASAFQGVPGIRVLVLFPFDEVSDRQRRQMTTLSGNIASIAVDGKFDDCQALVKQAFSDPDLKHIPLSSANSINIGRLLPQSVYYFYAASRIAAPGEEIVIATPSGNFGNMMGAVLARGMGLKVKKLIVPVNENDEFPAFLATGDYSKIEPSRNCLSNAMNVGHPSNLARLVAFYGGVMDEKGFISKPPRMADLQRDLFSTSVSDRETCETIRRAWEQHHLLLEPHGAVGWKGLQDYAAVEPIVGPAISLETAHPAKFPDEIQRQLGFQPEAPESLSRLDALEERYDRMAVDYPFFKEYLLAKY